MGKIQLIKEYVDVSPVERVVEKQAEFTEELRDRLIFNVTQLGEQADDVFEIGIIGGEIDIGEHASEEILDVSILRAMGAERKRSDQAHDHVPVLRLSQRVENARALGIEVLLDVTIFAHMISPNEQTNADRFHRKERGARKGTVYIALLSLRSRR